MRLLPIAKSIERNLLPMSTAITSDPFQGLRFFEDAVTRLMSEPRTSRPWSPAVDIVETEDALTLKADLPDVKIEDIDIRVENGALILRGSRKFEKDASVKGYHRIERSYGDFVRSFALPPTVETDNRFFDLLGFCSKATGSLPSASAC